jgi:serine/threonine-protein kinase SRK2
MKENEARPLFQQLLLAVDYCHKMTVANRDIKLENTLLSNRRNPPILKLTDFGFCKSDRDSIAKTMCGTPAYMGALFKFAGASQAPLNVLFNSFTYRLAF